MKSSKPKIFLFVIMLIIGFASIFALARLAYVYANVPNEINFQGKLTNINGVNVANGTYNFQVRIYNDPTADTGGALVYTQSLTGVQVTNGIFNLKFSPSGADLTGGTRYLQVCFDSNATGADATIGCGTTATSTGDTAFDKRFLPRKLLTSNPYSLISKFLGSNYIQGGNGADSGSLAFTGNTGVGVSLSGAGKIYFDSGTNKFKCSENGGAYVDCINTAAGGVTAIGTIDSQTKSSNGGVISGTTLYYQTADATNPGLVSTGTQTFAGAKTFSGALFASSTLGVNGLTSLNLGATITGGALNYTGSGTNAFILNPYGASAGNTTEQRFLELTGNGTEYVGFKSPDAITTSQIYTLPSASVNGLLKNTAGTLSWDTNTYLTSALTSINSQTGPAITLATGTTGTNFAVSASANTITFNLPDASAANRGVVTTGTQTFAGSKTFSSAPTVSTFTQGSVIFAGTSGLLSQNNSNFFWDDTGLNLVVGTTTALRSTLTTRNTHSNTNVALAASSSGSFSGALNGPVFDGTGTSFTTQIVPGTIMRIGTPSSTPATVVSVTSNTSLYIDGGQISGNSGGNYYYDFPIARFLDSSGNQVANINANGDISTNSFFRSNNYRALGILNASNVYLAPSAGALTAPSGVYNFFVGNTAGAGITTGSNNIAIGFGAQNSGNVSNSIVLNASGAGLSASAGNQFIVSGTQAFLGGVSGASNYTISPGTSRNLNLTGGLNGGSLVLQTSVTASGTQTSRLTIDSVGKFTFSAASSTPSVSGASSGAIYYDSGTQKFLCSENTGAYFNCFGATGGTTTIGTIDTQTKSADGAVISGSNLFFQTADATNPGLVSTGTQTFAGAKTFSTSLSSPTITASSVLNLTNTTNQLVFGSGVTGTLTWSPTTSNKTLTLPNETGTICTTGSICSGYQASGTYLTTEVDGVIGNEVTNTTDTTLTRSGSGTGVSPYTLGLNLGNANSFTATQSFTNAVGASLGAFGGTNTAGSIRFASAGTSGSNSFYTTFTSGTQVANLTYTLPTTSANGILRNTSGTLSWDTSTYLSSAITSINSQAGPAITLASGTSGTDFGVSASANTITFNLPDASASNRGVVTTGTQTLAGAKTFSGALLASSTLGVNGLTSLNLGATITGGALNYTGSGTNAFILNPYGASAGNTTEQRFLELTGNGTEYVGFKSPDAITTSQIYTLPQTAATGLLKNTSGILSWDTGTYLTSALTSINSQTGPAITFATGTSGTDFNLAVSANTLTYNLPDASAANRGVVTTGTQTFAGAKTFSSAPTVSTFTQGSVIFAGTSGLLSQNNSNFFWDDTNTNLNIGGVANPGNQTLYVANSTTGSTVTTSSAIRGDFTGSVDATAGLRSTYGGYFLSNATKTGANTLTNVGVIGFGQNADSTVGGQFLAQKINTTSIANLYGIYSRVDNANATGTVTNAYGLFIQQAITTGAITNLYGVYQNDTSAENYFGGYIGIGTTNPNYSLDAASTSAQIRFGANTNDAGGFLISTADNQGYVSGGGSYNGTNYIARATTATLVGGSAGSVIFHTNSGLTIGNTYTPTPRITISNTTFTAGQGNTSGTTILDIGGTGTTFAVCHSGTAATTDNVGLVDCTGTPAADYMEFYSVTTSATKGDIVYATNTNILTKDGESISKLDLATNTESSKLIGIVSDINNAGDFNSIGRNIQDYDNPQPIALAGRVPVKIDQTSNPIQPGDLITVSNNPGKGIKLNGTGFVIGKAIETWNPGQQSVMVIVENFYYNSNPSSTYFTLDSSDNLVASKDLRINGQISADKLSIGSNKLNIDTNGNLVTIGNIQSQNIAVNNQITALKAIISNLRIDKLAVNQTPITGIPTISNGKILVGQSKVTINNSNITANAKVFITSRTITSQTLSVTNINPGIGFDVEIPVNASSAIDFDYWIILE